MSQSKRMKLQEQNDADQQLDFGNAQRDWAAITQQWMLKTEAYSNDDSIPPAPLPPNISYLCYFDERAPDKSNVSKAGERNNCQPLSSVKVEPNDDRLIESQSTNNDGNFSPLPLSTVKVELERSESSSVETPRNHDNLKLSSATSTLAPYNRQTQLGYIIYIENPRNGILASTHQPTFSLRNDSEYWLPILGRTNNWSHIKDKFLLTVDRLCAGICFYGTRSEKVFKVCASLMNSAVARMMQNDQKKVLSHAHINGFFSIYRLLNHYARDDKEIIELSNRALTRFMSSSAARVKRFVPNLGEFLMHLTISSQWKWSQISNAFMDEYDARQVFWYCIGNYKSPATCPELIRTHPYTSDREAKVFRATTTSRNLVMFQVKFAIMTKSLKFVEFSEDFGCVHDIQITKLTNLYSTVTAIKNWDQFYDFLQMPKVSSTQRNSDLVRAVFRSAAQGYHKQHATNRGMKRKW